MDTGLPYNESSRIYYESLFEHAENIPLGDLEKEISAYAEKLRSSRSPFRRICDYFSCERDQYRINRLVLDRRKSPRTV